MEPAHNITRRMEDLTIKLKAPKAPNARPVTPYDITRATTTMNSTGRITQEMEEMTLNQKARAATPSTATTSSYVNSVFDQSQPQSHSSSTTVTTPDTTNAAGGYIYTTTPAGLDFSNPLVGSSRSPNPNSSSFSHAVPFTLGAGGTNNYPYLNTTTNPNFSNPNPSVPAPSTHQPQNPDIDLFVKDLLASDGPAALYKASISQFRQIGNYPRSPNQRHHTPYRPPLRHIFGNNRISKSRSHPSLRERYHWDRHQQLISAPFPSTLVHNAEIKRLPTETIYITKAEEEAEWVKERMNAQFLEGCLRRTDERVAAERAAANRSAARHAEEVARREEMLGEYALFPVSLELKEQLDGWRCASDIRVRGEEEDGDKEEEGEGVKEEEELEGLEYAIPRRTGPVEDDMMTDDPYF